MLQTYAVKITEFPLTYLVALYNKLPTERTTKLRRFHHLVDTLRGVTGDILTRVVLSEILHKPAYNLSFSRDFYGKPHLVDLDVHIGFNISHAGDWVVLVVSSSEQVGVDIERIQRVDHGIAQRFFADEEYASITSRSEEDHQSLHFYEIWTAKESYVKAVGKGLSIPLDSFSTVKDKEMARVKRIENKDWYFQRFMIDQNYVVSTCVDMVDECEGIQILDIRSIVDAFLELN
ncbi:4'-phosphopantetheinyl transferase [Paenibacillus turicensis]|uniref:4'-phosphopantetheinyl transferase n=1 Tax=Paenibacillus turicensis TaxID=160487 RepID=A0ABS4FUH6_9BACL|nr:4'-phosphopantetheinyl transferase superfamily protein [Paenibacillus turicensis]MBP1906210.1 4'-phosphopantetheinyl transferase [Paenibacillus turicensis]